ncbi:MAG: hypothetical protein BEV12_05465, partial [Microcystis aeruginosa CACIAM 03]
MKIYSQLIAFLSCLALTEVTIFTTPSLANRLPVSAKCQASLDRTQAKLKKAKAWSWQLNFSGGKVPSEFRIWTLNSSNEYIYNGKNNPWKATRNKIVNITVGEPGLNNVGNSPKFMESISQDIILSCSDVVLIKFWLGYEWGAEVG